MTKFFTLASTGAKIPSIGFGTGTAWYKPGVNSLDEKLIGTVVTALDKGFVHIDGAQAYNTAGEIGAAVAKQGIKRSDLFLTDKYYPGNEYSQGTPLDALKKTLKEFGLDYVDLYLIHAPFVAGTGSTLEELWSSVEEAQSQGLAKNIGVSNFAVEDLETILKVAKSKPAVNEIEFNPYLQNQTPGIYDYCTKNNILIEAYSPLGPITKGKPGPLDDTLASLSKKYSKTEGQILLRWTIQKGVVPITTSGKLERIAEYLDIFDFELTSEEVEQITKIGSEKKLRSFFQTEYSKFD